MIVHGAPLALGETRVLDPVSMCFICIDDEMRHSQHHRDQQPKKLDRRPNEDRCGALWQAQSDHTAIPACLSQHQWEWTLPRGFASRWLDALHLWWRGPSEPRLVVVETRRPVEKQTANQDPAPASPVCPDDRSARDRICVMARRWQTELWKASTSAQTTNISMSRRSRGQNITISSILSAHCPVPAAIALLAQIDWANFPRPRSDRDGRGRWPSGLHGGQYDLGGAYEDAADTAQLIYSHHSGPATTSG